MSIRSRITLFIVSVLCGAAAVPAHAGFSGTDVFLPAVGAASGVPPSVWYSTVWIHNPGATRANITVFLLERQANTAPLSFTDTLQPGETRKYDDAVQLMFAKETFGALRITSDEKVVVSCRVYSQEGTAVTESSGQFFAGVPASFAIAAGESTEVIGAHQTRPPAGSDFRFNFGFVEVTGQGTCRVRVTVKDSAGIELDSRTYTVRQWEQMQMAFANEFGAISSDNARLTVEVLSGEGKVIAFGSAVANGSQDPSTLEMAYADSLLDGGTPGGITGVTAGMGLSGGGTTGSITLDVAAGDGLIVDSDSVGLADGGVTKDKLSATGGTSGQVLGTDGDDLVWQTGSGLRLPFEGSTSNAGGAALKVTNTAAGNSVGIEAQGDGAGGVFSNSSGASKTYVSHGGTGVTAYGDSAAGYFQAMDGTGGAHVGSVGYGIVAVGLEAGGVFGDKTESGLAHLGKGNLGISASGDIAGGYFEDSNDSGWAMVGRSDWGIWASGSEAGGVFTDSDSTGIAQLGQGDRGIKASGSISGGRFDDSDSSAYAEVADGDRGISAHGAEMGGYFSDSSDSGEALVAFGDFGIKANGSAGGGFFIDSDSSGYANLGLGDYGITAYGNYAGGYFKDRNSSAWADVAFSSYKINGSGTVSFVQNHPHDPSSVIVYAAPEGDEVATYTRGRARLVDGEARVPLGETFRWVTNPDIGLTAHVTPREDCNGVFVAELSTAEVIVRELHGGTSECSFDYMVYGLRIGFESSSVVQEKKHEAYIPSMIDHRQLYERRPDLERYSSFERFKDMRIAVGEKSGLDLSRAHALKDAIVEFDPAVHEVPIAEERFGHGAPMPATETDDGRASVAREGRDERANGDGIREAAPGARIAPADIQVDAEGNVWATSFRSSARDLASLLEVSEAVAPGDVLVIDRASTGLMRRAYKASDPGVVGVVVAAPGIVLGTKPPLPQTTGPHVGEPDDLAFGDRKSATSPSHQAAVALAGVVRCKVDATFGAIWPGDLLVTSPTPGHAMRAEVPLPGTMLGKALEPLEDGTGAIDILVTQR